MFLQPYPELKKQPEWTGDVKPDPIDWDAEIAAATHNKEVPEIDWCTPGEDAALEVLCPPSHVVWLLLPLSLNRVRAPSQAFPAGYVIFSCRRVLSCSRPDCWTHSPCWTPVSSLECRI